MPPPPPILGDRPVGRIQRWLAFGVVGALMLATVAAFVVTERLKLTPSPIVGTRVSKIFSPTCRCATASADVLFRLRRGGVVDVQVVDSSGALVQQLSHRRYPAGWLSFRWFGRDVAGSESPDGAYHVRVRLPSEHRTIVLPNTILLDSTKPAVEQFSVTRRSLHVGERTRIIYRFSKHARPVVVVDGRQAVVGRFARTSGKVDWFGKVAGLPIRPGVHGVTLVAEDEAGNRSKPTAPISVRIRGAGPPHRTRKHKQKR